MPLLLLVGCLALLIWMIARWGVNTFLAFLITALLTGLLLGIPPQQLPATIQKGIGDMLGPLAVLLVCGAMIGRITADSGAARKIATYLTGIFGAKLVPWALLITGFLIGIPLFYNVGFILVVPLVFTLAATYQLHPVRAGVAILAPLSATHGFLPPHPSPAALLPQFGADIDTTLFYGLLIALPTAALAGPLFGTLLNRIEAHPVGTTHTPAQVNREPHITASLVAALLPIGLILGGAILKLAWPDGPGWVHFLTDPLVLMIVALFLTTWLLANSSGMTSKEVSHSLMEGVRDIGFILLVLGGAGAMKQVMLESGVSEYLGQQLGSLALHPLFLGWLLAALIRVALGSATVAGIMAANLVVPVWQNSGVDPNLMVLAIGSGSLMFSHVNDTGFWLFREYFGTSIKDTLLSWSIMETIISIGGLIGVFALYYIF